MPKQKPHKSLQKRVKVTARGKIVYKKKGMGHLLSGKSGRRKVWLRRKATLEGLLAKNMLEAMCVN